MQVVLCAALPQLQTSARKHNYKHNHNHNYNHNYNIKQWNDKHASWNFDVRKGPIFVKWFEGGTTNICYNALDR